MSHRIQAQAAAEEILSESDRHALYEMRRNIYMGGAQGGAAGFLAGGIGYRLAQNFESVRRMRLDKRHAFATPLLTLAMGAMLGSMVASRNNAHTLHYIVHKYSSPELTPYQERAAVFKELGSRMDPHYDDVQAHDHEAHLNDPLVKLFNADDPAQNHSNMNSAVSSETVNNGVNVGVASEDLGTAAAPAKAKVDAFVAAWDHNQYYPQNHAAAATPAPVDHTVVDPAGWPQEPHPQTSLDTWQHRQEVQQHRLQDSVPAAGVTVARW